MYNETCSMFETFVKAVEYAKEVKEKGYVEKALNYAKSMQKASLSGNYKAYNDCLVTLLSK